MAAALTVEINTNITDISELVAKEAYIVHQTRTDNTLSAILESGEQVLLCDRRELDILLGHYRAKKECYTTFQVYSLQDHKGRLVLESIDLKTL
ncbi:hypothetical protein C4573_01180 [Candidatus Woesearchaeota archaeon]|nr:MAG: hypothetical protein C4573_01180 [Candidatus Woesearchaeota archaeon]